MVKPVIWLIIGMLLTSLTSKVEATGRTVESGGIKLTVLDFAGVQYTERGCPNDVFVYAFEVEIENAREGTVLTLSPYNFEFRQISNNSVTKPSLLDVGCKPYYRRVLPIIGGTIGYREKVRGWIPFSRSVLNGRIASDDLELRYTINIMGTPHILKWDGAQYQASREKTQVEEYVKKLQAMSANLKQHMDNNNPDSTAIIGFDILKNINELGSDIIKRSQYSDLFNQMWSGVRQFLFNGASGFSVGDPYILCSHPRL